MVKNFNTERKCGLIKTKDGKGNEREGWINGKWRYAEKCRK